MMEKPLCFYTYVFISRGWYLFAMEAPETDSFRRLSWGIEVWGSAFRIQSFRFRLFSASEKGPRLLDRGFLLP